MPKKVLDYYTLSGEWAFMDEQYFTIFNDPEALEPSRNMINLRTDMSHPARPLKMCRLQRLFKTL